jgi:DNA-directed RNA polymerase subunit beta'
MRKVTVRIKEFEVDVEGNKTEKINRYETTVGRALLSQILASRFALSA